jgi:hypothetical protein
MLTARRLNKKDLLEVTRLKLSARTNLGLPVATFSTGVRLITPEIEVYFDGISNRYMALGALDAADVLHSYMLCLIDKKGWHVQMIVSDQSTRKAKFNGIELCTDLMIDLMEARSVYDFWYAIPLKYAKAHGTAWRKETKLLSRYEKEDYLTVKKGTVPNDKLVWDNLLVHTVPVVDTLIRHNSLPLNLRDYKEQ